VEDGLVWRRVGGGWPRLVAGEGRVV